MKFLLVAINAKYIHSNPAIHSLRASVGSKLRDHVELSEYTINHSVSEILADLYKRKPDVIAFSCYIWNIPMVMALVEELPKLFPGIPIWLGGPEVSFDAPKRLQEYPMLTGIMIGEGELTFQELLSYYIKKQEPVGPGRNELSKIAGLCLPAGYTDIRQAADISSLPFLYEDLEDFENRIIYYESGRGCPFRCSYCLSSIEKSVRFRDISLVKQELQFFLDRNVKQVKFVDRTFNCNHNHAIAVWQYLLEHDNGVTNFHFEIAADILNEEELHLLRAMRPGLVQLEIGVQTTNKTTLNAIHRAMDLEKLEQAVAAIRAGGNIHQHLDLIAGLPYEDYKSFAASFDQVYHMKPQQLQLGFLKVLKGSEMYQRAEEYGICYGSQPPFEVLYTKWLSYEQVQALKRVEEMVELYYNSNQFVHTLDFLSRSFDSPFSMFEKLAEFYDEKGYFVSSPSRSYRYQVLLDFATEYDKENEVIYKELLTFDLYLRENLKTRPAFATELNEHKEAIRNFYKQEEKNRTYLPDYSEYDSKQLTRMTHLEPFYFPVWDVGSLSARKKPETVDGKILEQSPVYILFDYQNRNPLTNEAEVLIV